jgi:microcompartment protein CcmK/EutM
MKKYLLCLIALLALNCFASVTVKVAAPLANSTVSAPFSMQASASSSSPIVGWHAYLDSVDIYKAGTTGSISAPISASTGKHQLVIRAWDSTGAYGDQWITLTVGSSATGTTSNGLPTPPSTAKVFGNIDQMGSGWVPCGDPACAGGSGKGGYWQALYQTSPSMDGSSMEFYRDGVWGNSLWHHKMGAMNYVTNFLWDFYFMVDSNASKAAQALEYDAFQFVGGYNYMIGTQCNYGAGVWDTWNEYTGHWLHTNIACPKFAPGTWHHIQWYMTTNHSNRTYTYKTLVVDGKSYILNQTQPAKYLAWGDNLGAQWQLDVNATGIGYHEWVDKAKLTVW